MLHAYIGTYRNREAGEYLIGKVALCALLLEDGQLDTVRREAEPAELVELARYIEHSAGRPLTSCLDLARARRRRRALETHWHSTILLLGGRAAAPPSRAAAAACTHCTSAHTLALARTLLAALSRSDVYVPIYTCIMLVDSDGKFTC